jgi:hypothetical protein
LINAIDNKYCSKCSYPLVPSAFDEIKEAENRKIQEIQQKYEQDMMSLRKELQPLLALKNTLIKEGALQESL